jgi:hypothetical protein
MKHLALLLAILAPVLATPTISIAQPGPVGIGFAQAEEGTWWCREGDPGKALACALDKCASEGNGQECHPTRWCLPAGWSGTMIVWLPEFHNTITLCGTSGEAALIGAFRALCDGSPDMTRCDVVTIIDPDGNQRQIEGASWLGPAARDSEASDAPEDAEPDAPREIPLRQSQ